MKNTQPENPERTYETLDQFLARGGAIEYYSVPSHDRLKGLEIQFTRPKGIPMLTQGYSWVCGFRSGGY